MTNILDKVFIILFGEKNIVYGKSLSLNQDLYNYFQKASESCKESIKNIVERFKPQRIVSIASGMILQGVQRNNAQFLSENLLTGS